MIAFFLAFFFKTSLWLKHSLGHLEYAAKALLDHVLTFPDDPSMKKRKIYAAFFIEKMVVEMFYIIGFSEEKWFFLI